MPHPISKDTQLCMSLAGRPGNFGTRFHNFVYGELGLDYLYKAFTTNDLRAAIGGVRALGIRAGHPGWASGAAPSPCRSRRHVFRSWTS